ncbi:oligosaccharide flippase family protein [Gemmatimonadota bacterium]
MADSRSISRIFTAKLILACLSVVTGVIVARTLGPGGKGEYALIVLVASMTAGLTTLNIGESTVFFFSRREIAFGPLLVSNAAFILATSLSSCSVLALLWYRGLLPWQGLEHPEAILFVCALIPLIFFQNHVRDLVRSTRRFSLFNLLLLLQPTVYLSLVLVFVVLLAKGVRGAVLAAVIANAMSVFVGVFALLRLEKPSRFYFDFSYLRKAIGYGLRGHIGNIFQRFNLRVDQLFIPVLWGSAMLGHYSVAVALSEMIWHVPDAIGIVTLPRISGGREEDGAILTARSVRICGLITLTFVLLFAVGARAGVLLLYGEAYRPAIRAVYFLLPGVFFMSLSKILSKYFSGVGRPEINTGTAFVALVATLGFCVALIPRYGMIGAALASSVAYGLRASFDIALFLRLSNVRGRELFMVDSSDLSLLRGLLGRETPVSQ